MTEFSSERKKSQEWQPEEDKKWPAYIQQRFAALNAAANLDVEKLAMLFKENESLKRPELYFFLADRINQKREKEAVDPAVITKLLTIFQSLIKNPADHKIIVALGRFGEPALNLLKDFARERNGVRRLAAAMGLGKLNDPVALPFLKDFAEDKHETADVRGTAIMGLGKLGEPALEILKKLAGDKDEHEYIRATAKKALEEKTGRKETFSPDRQKLIKSLITRQEPLLANPLVEKLGGSLLKLTVERLQSPLLKLNDIVVDLKEKYPEELIGLVVLGSLAKGYWRPESDLDWGLVFKGGPEATRSEITEAFQKKAEQENFVLCSDSSINVASIETQEIDQLEILFNGLFFGDRNELKKAQHRIVKTVGKKDWQKIQERWERALFYLKMEKRFGFSVEEVTLIENLRKYLWSLPDYEIALQEY